MKTLVTGGAGFIGSHVVERLLQAGHQVVVVDNGTSGYFESISSHVRCYELNIASDEMRILFERERPEAVFHLAAQSDVQCSIHQPIVDANTNIIGSIRLMEMCGQYGVRKFIYSSSAAIYGEPQHLPIQEQHPIMPLSPYGLSKYVPEQYLRVLAEQYGYQYVILRYANVYGARQMSKGEGGVISIFTDRAARNQAVTIYGDGSQTRDFIYVDDVAGANIAALETDDNLILNISTSQPTSIHELYRLIQRMCNGQEPRFAPKRSGDIDHSYLCNTEAMQRLNWRPQVSLLAGLERTLQYTQEKLGVGSLQSGSDTPMGGIFPTASAITV